MAKRQYFTKQEDKFLQDLWTNLGFKEWRSSDGTVSSFDYYGKDLSVTVMHCYGNKKDHFKGSFVAVSRLSVGGIDNNMFTFKSRTWTCLKSIYTISLRGLRRTKHEPRHYEV